MKRFVLVLSLVVMFSVVGCGSSKQRANKDVVISPQKETAAVSSGPVIELAKTEIDLGAIPADVSEIVGNVFFFNNGTEPLQIRKVHGPCSCFAGYSGDKLLPPGEGGQIEVKFDKSKIPAGPVKRVVNIETNDPANKKLKVNFSFNVERSKDEEELRVLHTNLTAMRKDIRTLRSDMAKVLKELQSLKAAGGVATAPSSGCGSKAGGKCSGCGKDHKAAKPKPKADTTVYDVAIGDSPVLGTKDAPVTITEFVDFQCPYCIREFPKIEEILKAYENKVQVVFKHYPLSFHKKAKPVHAATELALQEKGSEAFWKMHDMIMAQPKKLEIADLRGYAETLDLNLDNFDKTMADEKLITKLLADDKALAGKCGVRGTPTIMVNGMKLADRSIAGYKARIDGILKGSAAKPKPVAKKAPCANCAKKGCNDCGGKNCKGCGPTT